MSRLASHWQNVEKQRQSDYVKWLFIVAEAREAMRNDASPAELLGLQEQAYAALSSVPDSWIKRFQKRSQYAQLVKEALGDRLFEETLRYLRMFGPLD